MDCPNCMLEARVSGITEHQDGTAEVHYICVNPQCKNNRKEVGKKQIQTAEGNE